MKPFDDATGAPSGFGESATVWPRRSPQECVIPTDNLGPLPPKKGGGNDRMIPKAVPRMVESFRSELDSYDPTFNGVGDIARREFKQAAGAFMDAFRNSLQELQTRRGDQPTLVLSWEINTSPGRQEVVEVLDYIATMRLRKS